MPDPLGGGFLGMGKAFDMAIALIGGLATALWGWVSHRFKKVEQVAEAALPREEFEGYQERAENSRKETRENIVKLFDQLSEHNEQDRQRQDEIMRTMHQNHAQLLVALNSKADK